MTITRARRSGVPRTPSPAGESGATVVEYALMASLISAVISVTVAAFGQLVLSLFQSVPIPFG
jgi:Flp pilus assembly pilin Flp